MAGSEDPNEGGVRRRHSGHYEDSDGELNRENDGIQTGTRHVHDTRQSADYSGHRVRFSTDVERRPENKKRKSDDVVETGSKAPNLSVDTSRAAEEGRVTTGGGGSFLGEGTVKSPTGNTTSPGSPRYELGSPTARNRGMSLRSALFARNMGRRQSSGIELQDVGPSSAEAGSDARPQTAKKGSRASITVTPVEDVFENPIKPVSKAQTTSALPHYQQWVKKNARRHLPLERVQDVLERVRKFVLRIQEIPPSKHGRHIPLDASRKTNLVDERTGKPYVSNLIRSSKYTAWNFV